MNTILGLSVSEMWFYGGIAIMVFVVLVSIICIASFKLSGWKLHNQLEKDYGPEIKK